MHVDPEGTASHGVTSTFTMPGSAVAAGTLSAHGTIGRHGSNDPSRIPSADGSMFGDGSPGHVSIAAVVNRDAKA